MPDAHANFAYGTVTAEPTPAVSGGSLSVSTATGSLLPAAPFNATVWPAGVQPTADNAEIVRVTVKASGVLTITRAQEGSTAREIIVGDQIAATVTVKTLTDIETSVSTEAARALAAEALLETPSGAQSKANAAAAAVLVTANAYTDTGLSGKQPLDSDLTAIAALSTTSYGRSLLALADAAALRVLAGLGTAATQASSAFEVAGAAASAQAASQPLDSDLTAIAALSTTSFGRALLALADASALRTAAGLVIGTDVQAFDADLAAIAALTTTSFGRSLLALADASGLRTSAALGGVTRPQDHGLLAWSYDPAIASLGSTILATAGRLETVRLRLDAAASITNILIYTTTTATLTAGQCFAAIYQGGNLLGVTADQSTAWATSQLNTMALVGGPIAAAAGDLIVAFFANGSPLPTFARGSNSPVNNAGLATAASRYGRADTGRTTSMPGTVTISAAQNASWWVAVS